MMDFYKERGIGYCGLACALCSYKDCVGCVGKIANGDNCEIGNCAAQKGGDGCFACDEYPCGQEMFKHKRVRAFNRYMQDFGKDALVERLYINQKNGIMYHKPGDDPSDYDILDTEDEIYELLQRGRGN